MKLKLWVNWFMVLIIIAALLTSYCVLLLVRNHYNMSLEEMAISAILHYVMILFFCSCLL